MKTLKVALIILLVVVIALPLFGGRRGRRKKATGGPTLAFSIYGGAENLTGVEYADPDSSMYFSFGAGIILPLFQNFGFRAGLVKIDMHEDLKVYSVGTGVSGDLMYYFPVSMAFIPYGFGGIWYFGKSAENYSETDLAAHFGLGGEMQMTVNLFAEFGLDFVSRSQDIGGVESDYSYTPFFVHGGVRFPLFR